MLVRLETRLARVAVVAALLAGAAWLVPALLHPAVADLLAMRATDVAGLEAALAWDPEDPGLRRRLAEAYLVRLASDEDAGRARGHVDRSLRQRPTDAIAWLHRALLADREGDRERARAALAAALRLDPHNVALRWEATLLALRWGERDPALGHLRYVLAVDPGRRDAAFQLATTLLRPGEPVAGLLPADPLQLGGVLQTAIRQRHVPLAEAAWTRRIELEPALSASVQQAYLALLLEEGQGAAARRAWLAIVPDGHEGTGGNLIWNGGFETEALLGWGLDWRLRRTWGVEVGLDRVVAARGRQSLRLSFNSFPSLDFAGVVQTVPVEPGREYRLRALVRAADLVTQSGVKLQVVAGEDEAPEVLAETSAVRGTTADWVSLEARVRVPPGTRLVQVRLRREKAEAPEGNLGGKVWVDEVSLTPGTP